MSWEKKPPIHGKIKGRVSLDATYDIAPMDMLIAVGFGDAKVTKDNETVYEEVTAELLCSVQNAENEALKDPDHDWRIVLYAPLYGKCYQRQGVGQWVLIEENQGFA